MPQKRNPVALEHARAIASKAVGQAAGILFTTHNTPFGDIVDTEDDLQPLVGQMFHDAARAVSLVAAAMAGAGFDVDKLAARAGQNWITVTELADTLVRDQGLSFRTGHTIASRLIAGSRATRDRSLAAVLGEVSKDVTGTAIVYTDAQLAEILSPRHFVEVRKTYGGPSPPETARALRVSKSVLEGDEGWLRDSRDRLRAAEEKLETASAEL
jgi:argininosuccinate lyase